MGVLDWLRARRGALPSALPPVAAWEPTRRNSLAQWWAKRERRYIVKTGMSNRALRRSVEGRRRQLLRKGVKPDALL